MYDMFLIRYIIRSPTLTILNYNTGPGYTMAWDRISSWFSWSWISLSQNRVWFLLIRLSHTGGKSGFFSQINGYLTSQSPSFSRPVRNTVPQYSWFLKLSGCPGANFAYPAFWIGWPEIVHIYTWVTKVILSKIIWHSCWFYE